MNIDSLNNRAERIKRYTVNVISTKFCIPIKIEDSVARVIAVATMSKGDDVDIWVNGSQVNLKDIALEIKLSYRSNDGITLNGTPKMQEQE